MHDLMVPPNDRVTRVNGHIAICAFLADAHQPHYRFNLD